MRLQLISILGIPIVSIVANAVEEFLHQLHHEPFTYKIEEPPLLSEVEPMYDIEDTLSQSECASTDECCHYLFPEWAQEVHDWEEAVSSFQDGPKHGKFHNFDAKYEWIDESGALKVPEMELQSRKVEYTKRSHDAAAPDMSIAQFYCDDMRPSPDNVDRSIGPFFLQCRKNRNWFLQRYRIALVMDYENDVGSDDGRSVLYKGACVHLVSQGDPYSFQSKERDILEEPALLEYTESEPVKALSTRSKKYPNENKDDAYIWGMIKMAGKTWGIYLNKENLYLVFGYRSHYSGGAAAALAIIINVMTVWSRFVPQIINYRAV